MASKRDSRVSSRRQPAAAGFPKWVLVLVAALVALGIVGAAVYPLYHKSRVVKNLLSEDPALRRRAVSQIRKLGPEMAVRVATAAVHGAPAEAAPDVADALLAVVPNTEGYAELKMLELAASWASDEAEPKRRAAAKMLACHFKPEPRHRDMLLRLVEDDSAAVRLEVMAGMLRSAPKSLAAAQVAAAGLDDADYDVSSKAAELLRGTACDEAAQFLLRKAFETKEPALIEQFLRNLAGLAGVAPAALEPFLKHEAAIVRQAAVVVIGHSGIEEQAAPLLTRAFDDASSEVRAEVVEMLKVGRYYSMRDELARRLPSEPSKTVKLKMIKATAPLHAEAAAPVLARIAGNEAEDAETRTEALKAIMNLDVRRPEQRFSLAAELIKAMETADPGIARQAHMVASGLVRGRPPRDVAGWRKWLENKEREMALLAQIDRLTQAADRAEQAKQYDRGIEALIKVQELYNAVLELCEPEDERMYDERARQLNMRIRHMGQKDDMR